MTTQILEEVLNKVLSSERTMPAHFTSSHDRQQTFLIDFKQLSADDEYEMASQSWYTLPAISSGEDESYACLKIGEDIMVSSFIATNLNHVELIDSLKNELIGLNIELWPKDLQDKIKEIAGKKEMIDYFNTCADFGKERAKLK